MRGKNKFDTGRDFGIAGKETSDLQKHITIYFALRTGSFSKIGFLVIFLNPASINRQGGAFIYGIMDETLKATLNFYR